jgi:hypothetical protein
MGKSYIDASKVSIGPMTEQEERKVRVRVILYIASKESNIQKKKAEAFRKGKPVDGVNDLSLSYDISCSGLTVVSEDFNDTADTDLPKEEFISVPEDKITLAATKLDQVVRKYCTNTKYKSVILSLYIPYFSDCSFFPLVFLLNDKAPKCTRYLMGDSKSESFAKLDKEKSFFSLVSLTSVNGLNLMNGVFPEKLNKYNISSITHRPSNLEVKLAAIISHYTYYYCNWLEYKGEAHGGNVLKESVKDEVFKINDEGENLLQKLCTSVKTKISGAWGFIKFAFNFLTLNQNAYRKQLQKRIVSRINEVFNISSDLQKNVTEKRRIIDSIWKETAEKGLPIELYDLYNKCKYWNLNGIKKELEQEALCWKVVYPKKILEGSSFYHNSKLFDWADHAIIGDSVFRRKFTPKNGGNTFYLYYTTTLDSGMGWFSGLGSTLFIRETKTDMYSFIYSTNGTDFDSIGRDWLQTNILQGLTGLSVQHTHSAINAHKFDEQLMGHRLLFVGHSLGGGLASNNSIVTQNRHAITFNAAGLNIFRILRSELVSFNFNPFAAMAKVHPFRIKFEMLDTLQHTLLRILSLGTYQRAFGSNVTEIEVTEWGGWKSFKKGHGINNFLYPEAINQLELSTKGPQEGKNAKQIVKLEAVSYTSEVEFGSDQKPAKFSTPN